jgi:lipoyl-dependent peroxiredoxin
MKSYARHASVRWLGTRQRGNNTPSGVLKIVPRATVGGRKPRGTDPPELVAAAIAGSFSLTLAHELGAAGYKPQRIDVTATVTLDHQAVRWTLTQINLDVTATVPGVAECDFVDATLQAKANCPIARALSANILMSAKLSRNE